MSNDPTEPTISPFERIRRTAEDGSAYWSARDLADVLGYADWRNFKDALTRAIIACTNSGQEPGDHFGEANKMVAIGSKTRRKVQDYHLSRYACYLVIQNADPNKEIVALGQTYFAVQTRRQELTDAAEIDQLDEAKKRLSFRADLATRNTDLAARAQGAGVLTASDFATFQDHGYMGLYNGLRAQDIHRRKKLKPSQKILDYMGSEELAANIFRTSQADAKLKREGVTNKDKANQIHHDVGQKVRETIAELGGTMPEDQPTPEKSIQQIRAEELRRLAGPSPQLPLFKEDSSNAAPDES